MKILLIAIYLCPFIAFASPVFHIETGGIVTREIKLDICGEMDGDEGFDENVPVKRKTWCKEDVVIPQTDLNVGNIYLLEKNERNHAGY